MAWEDASGRPRSAQRRRVRPAVLAAAVLLGAFTWYAAATAQYEAYDLGYSARETRATVETWLIKLPLGYQLAWWKSNPPGPQDGLRILGPQ